MAKKGQPARAKRAKRFDAHKSRDLGRNLQMMRDRMPRELGGLGLTVKETAEKHGLSPTSGSLHKALKNPDVRAIHNAWVRGMLDRHREMGPIALVATEQLLLKADPYTVNQFWKRMGVDISPEVDVNIEKLEINAPPDVLEMVRKLAGGSDDDGEDRPGGGTQPPAANS